LLRSNQDADRAPARGRGLHGEGHCPVRSFERDCLRRTVGEREPGRLQLHHDAVRLGRVAEPDRDGARGRRQGEDLVRQRGQATESGLGTIGHRSDPEATGPLCVKVRPGLGHGENAPKVGRVVRWPYHRPFQGIDIRSRCSKSTRVGVGERRDRRRRERRALAGRVHGADEGRRRRALEERSAGEPLQERGPCGGRQVVRERERESTHGRGNRHRLLAPDDRELSQHRLRQAHRIRAQRRFLQESLSAGVGQHQRHLITGWERQRRRRRRREEVGLFRAFHRGLVCQDDRCPSLGHVREGGVIERLVGSGSDGPVALASQDLQHQLAPQLVLPVEVIDEA
jgi:hypothetical protein